VAPLERDKTFTELKETSAYIRKILPVLYEFLEGRKSSSQPCDGF